MDQCCPFPSNRYFRILELVQARKQSETLKYIKHQRKHEPNRVTFRVLASVVFFLIFLHESQALSMTFDWPVDSHLVTQGYGGNARPGKYHAGMDMRPSWYCFTCNPDDPAKYDVNVKAAATGTVVRVIEIEPQTCTTLPQEATQTPGKGCNDHGLGNTVILFHDVLGLYSLYAHLDSIDPAIGINQKVEKGQPIGKMGHSGFGLRRNSCPGFCPHLHFEVKDRGVISGFLTDDDGRKLSDGTFEGWGYTVAHPNWHGYHNPGIFLNETVIKFSEPVSVEVLRNLEIRDYPSLDSNPLLETFSRVITGIGQRTDGRLPAFVATRSVGSEWYQIHLPNAESEGWSASGWIAGALAGITYSEPGSELPQLEVISESARVREEPSVSSTLSFVYGVTLVSPQRFVPFESISEWQRIYLPQKSGRQDGWISASDAQEVCHLINSGDPVPDGWGASYNILSEEQELLLRTFCNSDTTGSSATVQVVNRGTPTNQFQVTWGGNANVSAGYKWMWNDPNDSSQGGTWVPITFTGGTPFKDSQGNEFPAWRVGAMSTIIPSSLIQPGINFAVAWVCTWTGIEWKCGCHDAACSQSFWQLQAWE